LPACRQETAEVESGGVVYRAESRFQIEHHQQSAKAYELADHHAEFENLLITELCFQSIKELVVHIVMSNREPVGIFDGEQFLIRESLERLVQVETTDFFFAEISCRLQESDVQSREAIIVAGDPQPNQLDQLRRDRPAFARRTIELEVAVE